MRTHLLATLLAAVSLLTAQAQAETGERAPIKTLVDDTIAPLMAEYDIPGMAVALSVDGQRHLFHYGLADRAAGVEVTDDTLFGLAEQALYGDACRLR